MEAEPQPVGPVPQSTHALCTSSTRLLSLGSWFCSVALQQELREVSCLQLGDGDTSLPSPPGRVQLQCWADGEREGWVGTRLLRALGHALSRALKPGRVRRTPGDPTCSIGVASSPVWGPRGPIPLAAHAAGLRITPIMPPFASV